MTVQVLCGDSREVLAGLEADSFAAAVTDPPYHLTNRVVDWAGFDDPTDGGRRGKPRLTRNADRGFMGKTWDGGDVAFRPETWAAVLRVLKPGAYLVAFASTRGYHRMVCAIEDAGFIIHPMLGWIFGCLSEDTEILIDGQWEPYHKARAGRNALCYDVEHDEYSWQPIEDLFVYDYDDTAFRIVSDSTDQLVSRNHRCLVERGGALVFELAEEAALEREARVPVLEDLPELLGGLSLPDAEAGGREESVWAGMCAGDALQAEAVMRQASDGSSGADRRVRSMRNGSLETQCVAEANQDAGLLPAMQWHDPRRGIRQTRAQGASGMVARSGGALAPENARSRQSSLEGRGDVHAQARQLQADQVRPLSARVSRDGAEGWLRDGAPPNRGEGDRAMSAQGRSGSPRGPRPARERFGQPDAVREQSGSQALRASRHTRTDLARIESVHYRGVVWCVKVPTGAFVARRNGKVFVTGNSGFPKAHNLSKAIDRAAGAEREVVDLDETKLRLNRDKYLLAGQPGGGGKLGPDNGATITAPATEAARQWEGWYYGLQSLKPALEPICMAQKPFAETTSAELHEITGWDHWCSTRSDGDDKIVTARALHPETRSYRTRLNKEGRELSREDLGEYAPFVVDSGTGNVLRWGTGAINVDAGRVAAGDNPAKWSEPRGGIWKTDSSAKAELEISATGRWPANVAHNGSPEVLAAFAKFGTHDGAVSNGRTGKTGSFECRFGPAEQRPGYADTGTAARFFFCGKASKEDRMGTTHPTTKPTELIKWLCKLVTPPGGTILDPFAGSGTLAVAAIRLGFDAVLIDDDPASIAMINQRLRILEDETPLFPPDVKRSEPVQGNLLDAL